MDKTTFHCYSILSSYYIPSIIEKAKVSIRYKRMYKMALQGLESGHNMIWVLVCKNCKGQNKNSRIHSFSQYPAITGCLKDAAEVFPQTVLISSKYSNMSYPLYAQDWYDQDQELKTSLTTPDKLREEKWI